MITVIGRRLIIAEKESQIGTTYDNNSEVRHIRINRITTGGVDLSNLRFRLDLEYEDAILDSCLLDTEVQENYILLTWNIPATCVSHKGTVWIAVRAYDENGTIKWATNPGAVYVGHTIFDGDAYKGHLTEFEQLEERIRQRTETLDANEGARQEAESQRQLNEEARLNNEAEWQRQAETAITEANTTLEMATEKAETAKREAATATDKAKEASDSAEAAGLSKDKAEMAANTAATKAQEVQMNVDAAAELKDLSLQAAITATDKAAEADASAERAESSTTIILQAEATVTNTAAQVKADAKTAADSRDIAVSEATKATEKASQADASAKEVQGIVEGLGGFDGTAGHVSALDTQGIAGPAGGTSNVQAVLNALAQKVALELVSNSALATMLSGYIAKSCIKNTGLVTEEGFAADARQLNPEIADTLAAKVKKNTEDIVTANSNLANVGGDLILPAATYNSHEIAMSWTELSTKIQSGDFKGLQVGDYKDIIMTTGEHARVELSGINTYINTGDNPILSTPHIVFTFRDCLETTYQYNSNQTNAGGYGATPLAATINTTIYDTLPSDLKSVIKEIRRLDNNKSGFAWASRKLWLPKETEIYGYSNSPYDVGSVQLPIFAYSYRHIIKGLGLGAAERGSQINWWTATPAADDNASFVRIYANGNFTAAGGAKSSYGIAPAFVIG